MSTPSERRVPGARGGTSGAADRSPPVPVDPGYVGRTIDRAAHRRTDAGWLAKAWPRSRVVVVEENRALVSGDPPRLVFSDPAAVPDGERLFLGVDGDVPYFAVAARLPEVAGARTVTVRSARDLSPGHQDLLSAALGLVNWHTRHGFSPHTGRRTEIADAGWTRRGGEDDGLHFPRTDPAVIVLISDGVPGEDARALLGRGVTWPEGRFSCLAGFVEPGESLEATVVREVSEEVGVEVTDVRYVTSQPWPYPSSLMVAFTAYADPEQPLRPDPAELAEARWFTRRELRKLWSVRTPTTTSVAYFLMARWLTG